MPITPSLLMLANIRDDWSEIAYWDEDDNSNDPFIGKPYRWQINAEVQTQFHSDHATLNPFQYNGTDITVGDWIASGTQGKALQIIEITSQEFDLISIVVEDVERWNLFTDPTGSGSGFIQTGPGVIFRTNNDGMPVLGPVPDEYLPNTSVDDLMARFLARNGVDDFVLVRQELHGMARGDVIYADFETDLGYKKVDAANLNRAIGIVTETGVPGLHYFSYRPLGKLINNLYPPLWGAHGDVYYLDPLSPGGVTNEKPTGLAIPVYLQLDLPTRAIQLERGAETSGSGGAESETNKYDVTNVSTGQTTFNMPAGAKEVLYMAINGIENENFTFDAQSKVLIFDPVETGYGIDVDDEVFFIYKS